MTEEELEQKAEEYCSKLWNCVKCVECKSNNVCKDYIKTLQAFKDGFREGQKENAELKDFIYENENREKELCILCENLKAQIEKMYTEEQVRECIHGACLDGQRGYDPSDLLINDYI